jgi:ubiquinone/menaquinone biosynthesis C-methylase UbiE
MNNEQLKNEVRTYWNKASCGTWTTAKAKFSRDYFEEIERNRYNAEPEIFAFAQFTRYCGQRVLEVGVGAGTDFIQWVRAGAQAYGVDLTPEAIANVKARLEVYELKAVDLQVADAESLPYSGNFFDVVYSWGVIHHSPDTKKCLEEMIRVTKPGGTIKIMVYNRHSFFAYYLYLIHGLLKGKPFQRLSTIIYNYQESLGTKAFTRTEILQMIQQLPVELIQLDRTLYYEDFRTYRRLIKICVHILIHLQSWWTLGWFMTIELRKNDQ